MPSYTDADNIRRNIEKHHIWYMIKRCLLRRFLRRVCCVRAGRNSYIFRIHVLCYLDGCNLSLLRVYTSVYDGGSLGFGAFFVYFRAGDDKETQAGVLQPTTFFLFIEFVAHDQMCCLRRYAVVPVYYVNM